MQFFYDRLIVIPQTTTEGESKEPVTQVMRDSINVNKIVRTMEYEKGKIAIMLDDGHEESREVPDYSNTGKIKGTKRERGWYASEIRLNEEDTKRFREKFDN